MKTCPFCGAELESDAVFCHHCMHPLTEKETLVPYRRRSSWAMLVAAAAVVAIVLVATLLPPRTSLPVTPSAVTTWQTTLATTRLFGTTATGNGTKTEETAATSGSTETDVTTLATTSGESGVSTTETTISGEQPSASSSVGTTTTTKSITTTTTPQKPGASVETTTTTSRTTTTTTRTATTATTTTTTKKPTPSTTASTTTTSTTRTTTTTAPVVASPLYYNISAGEVTVTGAPGNVDDLVIPSKLEGYPVTAIAANAFANRCIRSISLPDSLKTIGSGAFYESWGFTSVTIPKNVTHIGAGAFYSCDDLRNVYFNATNCSSSPRAFEDCRLDLVAFAPDISRIPDSLIYDSPSVYAFYIPKSVSAIPEYVYSGDCSTFSVYYEGSETDRQNLQLSKYHKFALNGLWTYNCDYERYVP